MGRGGAVACHVAPVGPSWCHRSRARSRRARELAPHGVNEDLDHLRRGQLGQRVGDHLLRGAMAKLHSALLPLLQQTLGARGIVASAPGRTQACSSTSSLVVDHDLDALGVQVQRGEEVAYPLGHLPAQRGGTELGLGRGQRRQGCPAGAP
eukprot:3175147-Pyramimonas_sp.AAC.1